MSKLHRVQSYLTDDDYERLKFFSSKSGVSESVVIKTALDKLLRDTDDCWDLLFKRLVSNERKYEELEKRVSMLSEILLAFIKRYLAYTPDFTQDEKKQLSLNGKIKFENLLNELITNLSNNKSVINKMLQVMENKLLDKSLGDFISDEKQTVTAGKDT